MPHKSKAYEAPRIEKLPFVTYGKHPDREVLSTADVTDIPDAQALVEEFGSPLFVVNESRLRADFRRFRDAFTVPGIDTTVAYSIKTNYLPAVCATLKQEGAAAEVVSEMEYDLARALGYEGSEIIFNGPHKARRALERAVGEGAVVNIDGFDELRRVSLIAATMGVKARLGLRMSFKYRGGGWTKFGFDYDSGDLHRALEQVAENDYLDLELLHNHCGTFVLNHDLYMQAIKRLIDGARHARGLGLSPRGVDVGGGFPSENAIKLEYDLPGGSRRKGDFWRPYADEICSSILDARELFGGRPRLILEPGRAVVDSSTQLLTTVVAKKNADRDATSVIVDAGVNLLPTTVYYDHPLTRVSAGGEPPSRGRSYDVYGPLCMQTDILRRNVAAAQIDVGDVLMVSHVGAYCHSQSMQFIETRPATVMLTDKGPVEIRRRETWKDVFALDHVPDYLRDPACRNFVCNETISVSVAEPPTQINFRQQDRAKELLDRARKAGP